MSQRKSRTLLSHLLFLGAAALSACSSSGNGEADGFQLTLITVPEGELNWQINRPIEFRFSEAVDFSTVNLNSIQIRRVGGSPATGEFSLKQQRVTAEVNGQIVDQTVVLEDIVVFQPTCPKQASPFPDAGFLPGGVNYEIRVVGSDTGEDISVRAKDGSALQAGQVRRFRTPESFDEVDVFQDPKQGPPQPVVRGSGLTPVDAVAATYLEVGGEGGERLYFELDTSEGAISEIVDVPLNLYSLQSAKVAMVVVIDQPVDPGEDNISSSRIGIEFLDQADEWQPVTAVVELTANCTEQGAELRIEPVGILPPTSALRVNISPEFRDIRGDFNLLPVNTFAPFRTEAVTDNLSADELKEDFNLSGSAFGSFEDTDSAFANQRAEWGQGALRAASGFGGTGGPGGDFDFALPNGQSLSFDTVTQPISSADLSAQQIVSGGIMQVRNFTLGEGSNLRATGPNPLVIFATGDVRIDGTLDVSGFRANNVQSLNLAQTPQAGGLGAAGGGDGGIGSPLTSSSSPRGGPGEGAFDRKGFGGEGGESGYAQTNRNWRRPGGGGAGVFGPDEDPSGDGPDEAKPEKGLIAQPGFDGFDSDFPEFQAMSPAPQGSFGAETGLVPARGGQIGRSPFLDAKADNDFWGVQLTAGGDAIIGELATPWAGSGGGGGGDAIDSDTFPSPVFIGSGGTTDSDYKGGGGGGGGGSIHILALGTITFGPLGKVVSNGGEGGTGESTFFIDRVGGGGGGGSGGHIILESNTGIDFSLVDTVANEDVVVAEGARGGLGLPTGDNPEMTGEFTEIFLIMGRRVDEGGTGGPGIVQLHVPGSTLAEQETKITLPGASSLDSLTSPNALVMVPSFGTSSRAQSDWVSLGGASPASGATDVDPEFFFDGTDGLSPDPGGGLDASMIGFVETSGNKVTELDAIYTGELLELDADAGQVVVRVSATDDPPGVGEISNGIYLANPALLIDFRVVLERNGVERRFVVSNASVQGKKITLTLSGNASLADFTVGDGIEIIPRFFRVVTTVDGNDQIDTLPVGQSIQVQFQAAAIAEDGSPDEDDLLVDWTGNIEDLNDAALLLPISFFRFAVIFETGTISPTTPRPSLEFLRVPFEFRGPTD